MNKLISQIGSTWFYPVNSDSAVAQLHLEDNYILVLLEEVMCVK